MRGCFTFLIIFLIGMAFVSCQGNSGKNSFVEYKGVYSFGPEQKSFKDCDNGGEFWVTDSSKQLELQYSQLKFEKPYEPVYVEVQGIKMRSGKEGLGPEYYSTLVVHKLIKITKEIPDGMCN
jgi:copper homeostasis protein (lipoprotein)